MGLATEMPISQMWRDGRSFMITEWPVAVMRMVLAREIFRGQRSPPVGEGRGGTIGRRCGRRS
jgi:hypothetical protein